MIKKIGIENYKAFKDYNEFEIKPITIFIGPNSAGKSTLLNLIAQLRPTSEPYSEYSYEIEKLVNINTSHLKTKKKSQVKIFTIDKDSSFCHKIDIRPGKFQSRIKNISSDKIVNHKLNSIVYEKNQIIVFKLESLFNSVEKILHKNYNEEVKEIENLLKKYPNKKYDSLKKVLKEVLKWFKGDHSSMVGMGTTLFDFNMDLDQLFLEIYESIRMAKKNLTDRSELRKLYKNNNNLYKAYYNLEKFLSPHVIKTTIKKLLKYIDEINDDREKAIYLTSICFGIIDAIIRNRIKTYEIEFRKKIAELNFDKSHYIPNIYSFKPLRSFPRNYYSQTELENNFNISSQICKTDNLKMLEDFINQNLDLIKINYEIKINEISHNYLDDILYVIKVVDRVSKKEYNLTEVGFGLSQIIPILTKIFSLNFGIPSLSKKILLLEQPEIHLHPLQQSRLADMFTKIIDYGKISFSPFDEDINSPNNYFIVETHSEHMIRAFQALVAQKKLSYEDLGIYYISKNNQGVSSIRKISINDRGLSEDQWPEGFFDQQYKLAKTILFSDR